MKVNEGSIDRAIRIIVGLALLSVVFIGPQSPWGWIGVIPLATGLVGFCPITVCSASIPVNPRAPRRRAFGSVDLPSTTACSVSALPSA
jgi:hypothetical protein